MTWIKFHGELLEGRKRGLSNATRFIFLSLSLKSRATRGVLELPRGLSDVDAVHDILGGSRKEIAAALSDLSDPEFDMVSIEGQENSRVLNISSWAKWNSVDETVARRQREYRSRKQDGNGDVTRDSAVTSRVTNGGVTRLDQSREDKRRSDTRDTKRDACSAPGAESSFSISESQARVLANLEALGAAAAPFAVADTDTDTVADTDTDTVADTVDGES